MKPNAFYKPRRLQTGAALAAALVIFAGAVAHGAGWEQLEPGLYYQAGQIATPSGSIAVHLVRTDFSAHRAAVRAANGKPRVPLSDLAQREDLVAVNGGYFENDGQPSGLVRSGGKTHAKLWGGGSGALLLFGTTASIIYKKNYPKDAEPADALQAGPVLVEPGGLPGIRSRSSKTDTRSFVAVPKDGGLIIGATAGLIDLYDLAEFLRVKIGVDSALNLDGGPSTGFYLRHPRKTVQIEPGWPVPNAIAISRRQAASR